MNYNFFEKKIDWSYQVFGALICALIIVLPTHVFSNGLLYKVTELILHVWPKIGGDAALISSSHGGSPSKIVIAFGCGHLLGVTMSLIFVITLIVQRPNCEQLRYAKPIGLVAGPFATALFILFVFFGQDINEIGSHDRIDGVLFNPVAAVFLFFFGSTFIWIGILRTVICYSVQFSKLIHNENSGADHA
jgi:hypothetical protein